MSICPKCKAKIDSLRQVTTGIEKCDIFFNEKEGWIDWKNEKFESDGIIRIFYCPECDEELNLDDEEAEQFLLEKDELKEIIVEKIKQIEDDKKLCGV